LGIDKIFSYLSEFGFGKKTGIDIEGESAGLLPSQEWKTKRFKQKWYAGDTVSVGIGQGYNLVTPMQLAVATAALANNGAVYQPHLVREVRSLDNQKVRKIPQVKMFDAQVPLEHQDLVRRAMIAVTQPGGTAVLASAGAPYAIAGKTGTAQVIGIKQGASYNAGSVAERHRDHAWFIAYAPADQPKIALVVLAENGGHGGGTAAPIARKVMDYYLLGKLPNAPVTAPAEGEAEHD
jgi:penicillin-binding protein 2